MIRRLLIRDLALMDRTELELGPGFTVVTGETGAGKSVLLGALSLLAGNRAAKTIVRKGAEECAVEAELEVGDDRRFDEVLKGLDLPSCEDDLLILKRSVHATKSGRISINGGSATLSQLQQLGELWIDFHGPGEPQKLMRVETQLEMLDLHAGLGVALATYRAGWRQRGELLREAEEAATAERLSEDEEAFLRSQLGKLDSLDLTDEAVAKLERDHARSSRAQELALLLGQLEAGFGSEGMGEVLPKLLKASDDVARIDQDAQALRDRIVSLAAEVEDIRADFARLGRGLTSDDELAAGLDQKMNLWLEFRRKYGPDTSSVREKREGLRRRLSSQGDIEVRVAKLKAEAAKVEKELRKQADALHASRTKAADKLASAARKMLGALGFKKADLRIEVASASLGPTGADAVRFLFCPNAGQDLLPLDQIASSGEAARVMLALKTVLAAVDRTPVLVFDEVDANVGGEIGAQVGQELAALGKGHQVFCVTHLPQVAALGHAHLVVTKTQDDKSTMVEITPVHGKRKERESELARMLGDRSSKVALSHARELLDGAK
ncbi:MAG: DNA repair protein RecN [Verrucomicrobia bacterium]|nr:DNA repair protein RecN [Verrucomicrobiota bacterium]NBY36438.1 DNA repair protein RecN [Verrucomicrobiota bacterium]